MFKIHILDVHTPGWHSSFCRYPGTVYSLTEQALVVLRWHKKIILDPLQAGKTQPRNDTVITFHKDKWTSWSPQSKGDQDRYHFHYSEGFWQNRAQPVPVLYRYLLWLLVEMLPPVSCYTSNLHSFSVLSLAVVSIAIGKFWNWASHEPG